MRKSELNNLMAGNKVISKKDNTILEVVAMDKEQGKAIMNNGKVYSFSTIYRWFDLAPVEEVKQPVEEKMQPKFKLGDKVKNGLGQIGEVVSVPHLVSYNGRLVMDGYRVRFTDNGETFVKSYSETYEGLTLVEDKPVQPIKPTNTSEKTVEDEIPGETHTNSNNHVVEGKNSRDELNNILITHNCYLKKMKQYEAVRSDRTKGTLIYIRFAKEGGYHFDVSQKTWSKLTKDYASWLIENFGACIKDKTRKLYRISCNNLEIFQVLLLTALS